MTENRSDVKDARATLDSDCPAAWYECRFIRNGPDSRVARWWNGRELCSTSQPRHVGDCYMVEYTDFIGPLVVPAPAPAAAVEGDLPIDEEWLRSVGFE